MYHGILNINKPTGWTSHDIVGKVRRTLGQREVGHAGTLDPLATGVLLVCVGEATRVSEYLMAGEKVYAAVGRLGITTDTYDTDGQVVSQADVPALPRDAVESLLRRFEGTISQRPPAYSAIKRDGVPAYRQARQGLAVELPPRQVTIRRIDLVALETDTDPATLTLEVTCAAGTYIRSLVHDLGQALGCGATLARLTRLRSGPFTVEDAVSLDALAEAAAAGELARHLRPIRDALYSMLPVTVDAAAEARLLHGQPIPCVEDHPLATAPGGDQFRRRETEVVTPRDTDTVATAYAVTSDGRVRAILAYDPAGQRWWPRKVFAAQ